VITPSNLQEYAGLPRFRSDRLYDVNPVGVSTGLAYSSQGGSVLFIESAVADAVDLSSKVTGGRALDVEEEQEQHEGEQEDQDDGGDSDRPPAYTPPPASPAGGRGDLFCTGQMGSVMKESTSIAYTVAKRILSQVTSPTSVERTFFDRHRIHLHVPSGATPKDGPSAGIALVSSLLSLALQTAPLEAHAMTGELSLTGRVLKIGGVKEKLMSAQHAGIQTVVLPSENRRDVDELKAYITEGMSIHYAQTYDEVFSIIFPTWKQKDATRPLPHLVGTSPSPQPVAHA